MIKFVQIYDENSIYGGVLVNAWLNGRSYPMWVPDKFNGYAHAWTLAVDSTGEVYAYEGTPSKRSATWTNNDLDFIYIGTFDDTEKDFEYDQWGESCQMMGDEIYF